MEQQAPFENEVLEEDLPANEKKGKGRLIAGIICGFFIVISFILFFAALWYIRVYGDTGFDSIVFTLTNDLGGVDSGIITSFIKQGLIPALIVSAIVITALFIKLKKNFSLKTKSGKEIICYPFKTDIASLISAILSLTLIFTAAFSAGVTDYVINITQETVIFSEDNENGIYVDPYYADITFPEEKQNLIIIYLESMETTFMTAEKDGGHGADLISGLYELAKENINFSHNDTIGGASVLTGGSWTIGALVSMTAGIPLKTPTGDQNNYAEDPSESFLPGVHTLSDILHENGYYQTMMVGSHGTFGGRKSFYLQHGTDHMYDILTARAERIVTPNYWDEWWGMEDHYLFQYAKQELTSIAANRDQPFAFSMLTVDTHAWGGHTCKNCENEYEERYDNVWKCSSKQVVEFVEWIQQQEWFENTTVVLTGDHLTMDNDYINRTVTDGFDRRIYNCFINARAEASNYKNRDFCTLDMLPTFLGAIGCDIKGDRLGLGTNLFSERTTLCEEITAPKLNTELSKSSDDYARFYIPRSEWENAGYGAYLEDENEVITSTIEVETMVVDEDSLTYKWLFPTIYVFSLALCIGVFALYRNHKKKRFN